MAPGRGRGKAASGGGGGERRGGGRGEGAGGAGGRCSAALQPLGAGPRRPRRPAPLSTPPRRAPLSGPHLPGTRRPRAGPPRSPRAAGTLGPPPPPRPLGALGPPRRMRGGGRAPSPPPHAPPVRAAPAAAGLASPFLSRMPALSASGRTPGVGWGGVGWRVSECGDPQSGVRGQFDAPFSSEARGVAEFQLNQVLPGLQARC